MLLRMLTHYICQHTLPSQQADGYARNETRRARERAAAAHAERLRAVLAHDAHARAAAASLCRAAFVPGVAPPAAAEQAGAGGGRGSGALAAGRGSQARDGGGDGGGGVGARQARLQLPALMRDALMLAHRRLAAHANYNSHVREALAGVSRLSLTPAVAPPLPPPELSQPHSHRQQQSPVITLLIEYSDDGAGIGDGSAAAAEATAHAAPQAGLMALCREVVVSGLAPATAYRMRIEASAQVRRALAAVVLAASEYVTGATAAEERLMLAQGLSALGCDAGGPFAAAAGEGSGTAASADGGGGGDDVVGAADWAPAECVICTQPDGEWTSETHTLALRVCWHRKCMHCRHRVVESFFQEPIMHQQRVLLLPA
jgi:hypothetical protein